MCPTDEPCTVDPPHSHTCGCFHGSSIVELSNGELVRVDSVPVGASVAAMSRDGRKLFSKITSFHTAYPNRTATVIKLAWAQGALMLSSTHMVFASASANDKPAALFASEVRAGMVLWQTAVGADEAFVPLTVTAVSSLEETGFFSPVTEEGSIVVNGVAASVYTDYDHDVAHNWLFAAPRAWHSVFPLPAGLPQTGVKQSWAWATDKLFRDNAVGRALMQSMRTQ